MKQPLLIAGFLLVLSSAVGCGTNTTNQGARTVPAYAYEVVWNGHYYVVGEQVNKVGAGIGTVKHFDANPKPIENNGSNFFPVGTKLFSIPGKDTKNQIAGEYNGRYWECHVLNQNGS